jgi:hypothetical protein
VELSKATDSGAPPLVFSYKSYLNQYNTSAFLWMQSNSTYHVTLITSPDVAGEAFWQQQWCDMQPCSA